MARRRGRMGIFEGGRGEDQDPQRWDSRDYPQSPTAWSRQDLDDLIYILGVVKAGNPLDANEKDLFDEYFPELFEKRDYIQPLTFARNDPEMIKRWAGMRELIQSARDALEVALKILEKNDPKGYRE